MTNKQLQEILGELPPDLPLKIRIGNTNFRIVDLTKENFIDTSDEDYYDEDADVIHKSEKDRFLLFNPIIY